MPFETEYRLTCDHCDAASDWLDGAIFTRGMVVRELRKEGWVCQRYSRLHGEATLCPKCSGKGPKETAR
jgi:hypothetical protein